MPIPMLSSTARVSGRSVVRHLIRLWPWMRPVGLRLVAATVLAAVASCLALVMPLVLKWIVDGPVADRDAAGVWLGGGMLVVLGGAEAGIFGLRRWLVARPLAGVEARMRQALYRHVQRLPIAAHGRWPSGQLLSRATTDLQLLHGFLAMALPFLVVNAVTLAVGCVILLAQQWLLGLVLLAPVPALLVVCALLEARYAGASRLAQDQVGEVATAVQESILGVRVIKGFGRHREQAGRFRLMANRLRDTELGKARLLATVSVLLSVLPDVALAAVLVLGVAQVAGGTLSAGTLLAVVATALVLKPSVNSTGELLAVGNEAAAAAARFVEVMDTPTAFDETAESPVPRGTMPAALVFDQVRFRYPGSPAAHPDLLRGITLRIEPGETLALVGATGSGKSTLAALVPRLYEPSAGQITLDGVDIAAIPRGRLRGLIAVAFQEPTLFSGSIADNVLMGTDSTNGAELDRALRIARADEFVRALPHRTRTLLGEQGMSLSAGQRQRLALARAVAARPSLLVLDDPLSALDIATEAQVETALRRVLAITTALIVAHRPSTVLLADRVALLSGGRITAIGTHRGLLETNREYAALMTPVAAR